jgi:hypothetical protein
LHRLFARIKGLTRPGTMILLHLASRLNPVNGIWGIGNPLHPDEVDRLHAFLRPKSGRTVGSATICQRISQLLLHCCNTRHAIEGESRFRMRSSLVIRIAADQDKFDKQGSGT